MDGSFELVSAADPRLTILRLHGDLDCHRAAAVREAFARVPRCGRVLIDLADVHFIDSAGLGALIGGLRRIHEDAGSAAICRAPSPVRRVLHMTGVDRLVPVEGEFSAAAEFLCDPAAAV